MSWEHIPKDFVHGILLRYEIHYWLVTQDRASDAQSTAKKKLQVGPGVTFANLTRLESSGTYRIEIAGVTIKGFGTWTAVMASKYSACAVILFFIEILVCLIVCSKTTLQ